MPELDYLIIGGGVSGLAAARFLRERGHSVEVWEASPEPGGWARSEPWGEGLLEPAAQVLFRSPGSVLDRVLGELGLPLVALPGRRWMARGDRAHPLPGRSTQWMASPLLPFPARLRVGWGLLRKAPPKPGETLEGAARARFGATFARDLLPALGAGLFAAPPDRLAGTLLPVLVGRAAGALVRPEGGIGTFVTALARNLPIRTHHRLDSLERLPDGAFRARTGGTLRAARQVVLALPAPRAAAFLEAFAPEVARDLRAIPFLDLRFRHSRHPSCPELAGGWGLLCDPAREGGLLGFTCVPGPGATLQLRCGLGGGYPVTLAPEGPDSLEAKLRRWFPSLEPPMDVRETRADQSLPLPGPEHGARIERIEAAMPHGLSWLGAGRFPGGIPGILGGVQAWADRCSSANLRSAAC